MKANIAELIYEGVKGAINKDMVVEAIEDAIINYDFTSVVKDSIESIVESKVETYIEYQIDSIIEEAVGDEVTSILDDVFN